MSHDWDDVPSSDQILSGLGYEYGAGALGGRTAESKERTLLHLKAAVDMVVNDTLGPAWLRTQEQIDGGAFPGPWLKPRSDEEVLAFLLEYDAARANPTAAATFSANVNSLISLLPTLSKSVNGTLLEQLARTHNYEYLLGLNPLRVEKARPLTLQMLRPAVLWRRSRLRHPVLPLLPHLPPVFPQATRRLPLPKQLKLHLAKNQLLFAWAWS